MKILFVCEYNACRSQMAEGLARTILSEGCSPYSAGLYPGQLNEMTVEVMQEIGVDLSGQYSKTLAEMNDIFFDLVVVLAEPAWKAVQEIQTKQRVLWHFYDPVAKPGSPEQLKEKIRVVRDGLKERIQQLAQRSSPS